MQVIVSVLYSSMPYVACWVLHVAHYVPHQTLDPNFTPQKPENRHGNSAARVALGGDESLNPIP